MTFQLLFGGKGGLTKPSKILATGVLNKEGADTKSTAILDYGENKTAVCVTSLEALLPNTAEVRERLALKKNKKENVVER